MVEGCNKVYKSLGEILYGGSQADIKNKKYRRSIYACKDIFKGEFITKDKIAYKRTNSSTYMSQINIMKLIGLKAKKDIPADSFIDFSNVEYEFKKTEFKQFKIKK